MSKVSFAEMVSRVGQDMNLDLNNPYQSNTNVVLSTVKRYLNEAQSELQKELLKTREDYFLTSHVLPITAQQLNNFRLPDNIYVNKIRKVAYNYQQVKQVLRKVSFDDYVRLSSPTFHSTAVYPSGYFIREVSEDSPDPDNPTLDPEGTTRGLTTSTVISFVPVSSIRETGTNTFEVFYLRQIRDLINDGDYADIPESESYLVAYAKWQTALTDPTRNEDLYFRDYQSKLLSLIHI